MVIFQIQVIQKEQQVHGFICHGWLKVECRSHI